MIGVIVRASRLWTTAMLAIRHRRASPVGATLAAALGALLYARPTASTDTRVHVVERGTLEPIANATVEMCPAEVHVSDDHGSPYIGDKLIASGWFDEEKRSAVTDKEGYARFGDPLEGDVMLVASTPTHRGARVFLEDKTGSPREYTLEIGVRHSIEVAVVDSEGVPRAGVAVAFGRFIQGVEPRHHLDGDELWDDLGTTRITDGQGLATLDELELHGSEDLEILRGHTAGPFGARALVFGTARCLVPVDPDKLPPLSAMIQLPPCGRAIIDVEDARGRLLPVEGEGELINTPTGSLAPGFPRSFRFTGGRAELQPIDLDMTDTISVSALIDDDGSPFTRWSLPMGWVGDPILGDKTWPSVVAEGPSPSAESPTSELHLRLGVEWFIVTARLRWRDGAPAKGAAIDWRRTLVLEGGKKWSSDMHQATSDAEGVLRIVTHRPLRAGDFGLALTPHVAAGKQVASTFVPLVFGEDPYSIDLGEVTLSADATDRGN